jgi:hypothetical protein
MRTEQLANAATDRQAQLHHCCVYLRFFIALELRKLLPCRRAHESWLPSHAPALRLSRAAHARTRRSNVIIATDPGPPPLVSVWLRTA